VGPAERRGDEETRNPSAHMSASRCDNRREGSLLLLPAVEASAATKQPRQPAHEPPSTKSGPIARAVFPPIPFRATTSTTGACRTRAFRTLPDH